MAIKQAHKTIFLVTVIVLILISAISSFADTINYVYDDLYRLIRSENVTTGKVVEYQYDAVGNRLQKFSDSYRLTVSLNDLAGGVITSSPAGINCGSTCWSNYAYGTSVTLTATPSSVYDFIGWSGACVGTGPCNPQLNSDMSVTANFALKTFVISASAGQHGSISPSGNVVASYGSNQTFTITPASGAVIGDVLVDGNSVGAISSYTFSSITSDHTIVASFSLDSTPPIGTISINSGAGSTNHANVTLALSCNDASGCSQMQLSSDGVTDTSPEAFATTKTWTLTSGDESKTVYVKFKDSAGNWSTPYGASILLDTSAPVTMASPAGGTYGSAQSVTLSCNDGTGSGCEKIYYTVDGSMPTTASTVYSVPISITVTTTLKFFANDLAGNSETVKSQTYTITAGLVTVQLQDSTGSPLSGGVVQYYSGGWKTFGTTDITGQATNQLPPGSYTFSISYGYAQQQKAQNIATDPTVVFQTKKVTVQLKDSSSALMDTGTVQYYSGAWRDIGSTSGGQVSKELLPGNYTFKMGYGYAQQQKAQNIATDPTVVFQTTKVTVQLQDSTGALMDTGTVQYYSGAWRNIGNTSGGQVSKELLPGNYTFSMSYGYAQQQKAQNIATDPTVVFQTTKVTVQLQDSTGALMDTGTVQYYAGVWRDIGNTSGGQVSKELLPGSYTFSMRYRYAQQQKAQNITTDPTVMFSAGQVHSDSNSCTYYYAGAWRVFTQNMELLPVTYTFQFNDGTQNTSHTIISGTGNHIH